MGEQPIGFPAAEAIRRLLAARNRGQDARVSIAMEASPAGVLEELGRFHLHGRWAKVPADALGPAQLPTLAPAADGTFLLLRARRGRRILIEGQGLARWSDPRREAGPYGGTILDVQDDLAERTVLRALLGLILARKELLASILVLTVAAQGLTVLAPLWTRILVDRAFPSGATSLFGLIVAAALAQALFRSWLDWLQGRYAMLLENRVAFALERGFLHRLFSLPFRFFNGQSLGKLLQGVQGLAAAREFLISHSLPSLVNAVTAVIYLAMLCHQVPVMALFSIGMALVPALILAATAAPIARLQVKAVATSIKQWGLLAELFNGLPTLKAAGAEGAILDRWTGLFWRERSLDLRAQRLGLVGRSGSTLAGQLQAQILNIWGALAVMDGSISLGTMLAFTMIAGALQGSVAALGELCIHFLTIKPHVQVTTEILAAEPESPPAAVEQANPSAGVEVVGLSFRYHPDRPWVLRNWNVKVGHGEVWRIPGGSGSGKTTLLRLLAGLLEPEAGGIRLFGLPPRAARAHLCYLPQRVRLFQGTVLDNLRLFSAGASWKRLQDVSAGTGLAQLVARMPMKWDTWVAMGGSNFSAGERQLVALTGVLAAARNLLLLDEAMANLDHLRQSEMAANPLFRGKTIIYASHGGLLAPGNPCPPESS